MKHEYTIPAYYINKYFTNLVNAFYKILPMTENREPTRVEYMCSLRREMLGMQGIVSSINGHPGFLSLLNILSYLIGDPQCSDDIARQDVFKAISICKRIAQEYAKEDETDERLEKI